jgi:uncharacterized membrane protein YfcA
MNALNTLLYELTNLVFSPLLWLVLVGLAIWQLRRTQRDPAKLAGRGQLWRRAAIVLLMLIVGGFGICGGWGVVTGVASMGGQDRQSASYGVIFLVVGGAGLALALVLGWVLYRYTRSAKAPPSAAPADNGEPT